MQPLKFSLSPPISVTIVKAALSLKARGESCRVIGSSVTHAFVSDSDMSNNEGDAWSPSYSTISIKGYMSAIWWAVTHPCSTHLTLERFYNSNGTL